MTIALDRPFAIGDFITVDNVTGTVEHVGLKTTRLRSISGEQIIMAISQSRRPPVHGEMLKIVYQVPKLPGSGAAPRLSYASYTGRDGKAHVLHYAALATPPALQHIDVMPAAMVALWDPLPGARISSPFGWRLHPVFHTRLFHKGVDYESVAGTAIIAAADGVIEDAGWRGNYGNYIRIRHSDRWRYRHSF